MNNTRYEIESRSDFLTGMYLVACIPDDDVDENALLTIKDDCPDFILPFSSKSVNGQTEFTYKVGTLCKFKHIAGNVSHAQYLALWNGLLRPLLDCRDWFMNPRSFVLDADYLYFDKQSNAVAYVYIPSHNAFSEGEALKSMVVEVAKSIKTADPDLENKVLRSVIGAFNPNEFLSMLGDHTAQSNMKPPALPHSEAADITQETNAIITGSGLRCVGRAQLPQYIEVDITDDQIFTIGRHDARLGKKQSSFEFEAKTKAISRRHAVIERTGSAFTIVDLSSSAGTFVNEKKIPPNTPTPLESGFRVSFGNMGADYVWEAG